MTRLFLIPVVGLAALVSTTPAQAQTRGWLGSGQAYLESPQASSYDSRRLAYDNGFREGLKEGEKDGRKNDRFAYQDEKGFQRADKGYHREYGSLDRYRQSFRSGYADGYADGYRRYSAGYGANRNGDYRNGRAIPRRDTYPNGRDTYPNGRDTYPNRSGYPNYPDSSDGRYGGYRNDAVQSGVNDGYEKGVEDARKNRSFDPLRHAWYRSGDRHYDSRYGSREQYKDLYRRGFRDGYERGFREGRYR
jgi:hypothetical protein